jgi:hypothetical protein
MTTNRTSATCPDCGVKLTSSTRSADNRDYCHDCYDYAGWENTHDDEAHDELSPDADCRVCRGDVPGAKAPKAGHTNGKPLSHTSHAGHDHPATKAARAACRKAAKA